MYHGTTSVRADRQNFIYSSAVLYNFDFYFNPHYIYLTAFSYFSEAESQYKI